MRRPFVDPKRLLRSGAARLAALLVLLAGVGAGLAAFAASDQVANPHGKFREDCSLCHRADAWTPAVISRRFDHAKYGFPLTGAHAAEKCTACHATLEFQQSRMNCAGCHEDPHRGEMGADCARCHNARSFADLTQMRRLHQTTRFPLSGGHAGLDCESCHKPAAAGQMQFVGTRAACVDCHMNEFRTATDPDHSGFSTDCSSCHTPLAWRPAHFDHAMSGFPLTGAHRAVACNACHVNNVFKGTPKDCYSCHRADYDGTTAPAHASAGFPTSCQSCHNTTSWNASFDHNTTAFPLTGAHKTATCQSCHGDGVYAGKSTLCYSCHATDYNGTTDPKHVAPSFPTTCQNCHSTTDWTGASFNHSTTAFPLTGAHVTVPCSGCHGDGVYAGKSTLCYSCHTADYNGTTNPGHAAAAFPTTCQSCHTTTSWAGATFDHDTPYFRIYSGRHQGLWTSCSDCHNNPASYAQFNCLGCHPHDDKAQTDSQHAGRSGYSYTSSACYSCHRTV